MTRLFIFLKYYTYSPFQKITVLHPQYKHTYFGTAVEEQEWIKVAEDLLYQAYHEGYKKPVEPNSQNYGPVQVHHLFHGVTHGIAG